MAQEVLIDFKVDYSQLDSAIDVLEKTGQVDAKIAQSFKSTNQAIAQQATAVKGVATAYKGPLTSLDQLDKRSKKFVDEFIKGFEQGVKAELIGAKKEIDLMRAKFEQAGTGTTKVTQTLKQELKSLTAAIAEVKATGGPVDAKMLQRAGQLKDAIADANAEIKNAGSDTRGLDNLIGTAQAVAGGFAIVQGSAALFGDESEDLQKTLLKVNAAMAVLQGLQSIQNALQKEGAITKALQNAQTTIAVVQTNLETAAKSRNVVVSGLATAAQWLLNAAMAANPIGAVVVALVALTAILVTYTRNTRHAAEATGELMGANKNLREELDKSSEAISRNTQREVIDLQKAYANESEIMQARINGLRAQIEANDAAYRRNKEIYDKGLGDEKQRAELEASLAENRKKTIQLRIDLQQEELDKKRQVSKENADLLKKYEDFERESEERRKELADKAAADREKADKEAMERAKQNLTDKIALLTAEKIQLDKNSKAYNDLTLKINLLQTAYDNLGASIAETTLNWVENKVAAKDAISAIQGDITGGFAETLKKVKGDIGQVGTAVVDVGGVISEGISGALDDTRTEFQSFLDDTLPGIAKGLQALGTISQGLNALSQERQQNQEIEIENSRREVDALLEAGAITEKEAEARQKRIDRQEKVQRTKAAQQAKQLAIFQAIISTAQAVVNALATPPAPVGIALAAVVGALGAAQVAAIASRPIPKFATGKKGTWSGVGMVGDAGAELVTQGGRMFIANKPTPVYLGPQDKVYTAAETRRMLPMVDRSAMAAIPGKKEPSLMELVKAMPQNTGTIVNIDKEFISEAVANGLAQTNYRDRRYGSK